MVLIPLKCAPGVNEWVTLELQGEIECYNQEKIGEAFRIGTVGLSKTVSKPVTDYTLVPEAK